ncbi:DNA methyltransferase [Candidatus Alkanophaga liquidiphilum]
MGNWAKIIIGDSRRMPEVEDESIGLVVTSPPYWHIKDYGVAGQIGYGQTLHEYLKDLYRVWKECYKVLKKGRRLCINIGDQFARAIIYGRYKIIPLHAEIITQCENIGFDYMGAIIWQKKTTMHTTGGANVMGSFPYPPNGMVEIDYEFILIFKKPGKSERVSKEIKEQSKLTKEEWKGYFCGHWRFGGAKQIGHEAMFPEELPRRLIKMFTFVGDTVLDPFAGSGTTVKAALEAGRNAIGYEINRDFLKIIRKKFGESLFGWQVEIVERKNEIEPEEIDYTPNIKDAKPLIEPNLFRFKEGLYKVVEILSEDTVRLDTSLTVRLLGVDVLPERKEEALNYLRNFVRGKKVFLRFDSKPAEKDIVYAYVYLKNKIFINKEMVRMGLAKPANYPFSYKKKFIEIWKENG